MEIEKILLFINKNKITSSKFISLKGLPLEKFLETKIEFKENFENSFLRILKIGHKITRASLKKYIFYLTLIYYINGDLKLN